MIAELCINDWQRLIIAGFFVTMKHLMIIFKVLHKKKWDDLTQLDDITKMEQSGDLLWFVWSSVLHIFVKFH